jgi:hypothetical protein
MNALRLLVITAAAAFLALPAAAQQMKTVNGLVINIGIADAIQVEHVDAQHGVHTGGHGSGVQHIVVAIADQKSGARIADATVTIEVRDPKGVRQKKPAMAMVTAGFPDYSEVFDFGWSGKYVVRVVIQPKNGARPIEATFTVNHFI